MANTQAITNVARLAALKGVVLGTDTVKAALYLSSASIGAASGAYTATGEATGTGYTAGGVAVTHSAPTFDTTKAVWGPSADITYSSVTIGPVDCVLLYNVTRSNESMGAFTFGAQTLVAGDLILAVPAVAAATALLRI